MTISSFSQHDFMRAAEQAAAAEAHCRIVYKDELGEHHAVMAMPKEWREIEGVKWGFFTSDAGALLEVRLDDILAIELPQE